jgi:AcrR family transcriptional regulator
VTEASKRPRADARRNRAALLRAAQQLVSRDGTDISLDEVASLAGVARATRYRHFPTREALLEALMRDFVAQLADALDAVEDPADAFLALIELAATGIRDNPGLLEVVAYKDVRPELREQLRRETRDLIAAPLRRAQEAGRVRADLRPSDFSVVVALAGTVAELGGQADGEAAFARGMTLLREALAPQPRLPLP